MEPKMEQPKQHTPEEIAELEKSRTISDAELLKGGAEYKVDEMGEKTLIGVSEKTKKSVKAEMWRSKGETLGGAEKIQFIKDWLREIGAEDGNKEIEVTFRSYSGYYDDTYTQTGYYRNHGDCFGLTDKPRYDKSSSDMEGLCHEFKEIEKIEEL